ncbi:MAG TPA: hypothetical protein PLJ35_05770 [Anaerolineae bacterium]|mgnify:CR=1 FL=1|nr:hypothetical protein [Anaerolineae bacterium]HOQ98311.1 hypothetical protein [Anaerolineae bacterium]HPL28872.1 hypothetical protein [Anaerolineae bacterium]
MRTRFIVPVAGILALIACLSACQISTPVPAPSAPALTEPALSPTAPGGRVEIVTATPTQVVLVTTTPIPATATAVIVTATPPESPAAGTPEAAPTATP